MTCTPDGVRMQGADTSIWNLSIRTRKVPILIYFWSNQVIHSSPEILLQAIYRRHACIDVLRPSSRNFPRHSLDCRCQKFNPSNPRRTPPTRHYYSYTHRPLSLELEKRYQTPRSAHLSILSRRLRSLFQIGRAHV